MAAATLQFQLNANEVAALNIPANGNGGFQSLIRNLQTKLNPATNSLDLTDAQIGKIVRYLSYRPGGFEGRLAEGFRRNIRNFMG